MPRFQPRLVVDVLNRHGVRYVLIGGVAATLHGSAALGQWRLRPARQGARLQDRDAHGDAAVTEPENAIVAGSGRQCPRQRIGAVLDGGDNDQAMFGPMKLDPGYRAAVAPPLGPDEDLDLRSARVDGLVVQMHAASLHPDDVFSAAGDQRRREARGPVARSRLRRTRCDHQKRQHQSECA